MDTFQSQMFGPVRVLKDCYYDGCLAIQLVEADDEEDYIATLSVYIPDHTPHLRVDEFFPRTWCENKEIAREALASGVVINTGARISTPVGPMPVWRCR